MPQTDGRSLEQIAENIASYVPGGPSTRAFISREILSALEEARGRQPERERRLSMDDIAHGFREQACRE